MNKIIFKVESWEPTRVVVSAFIEINGYDFTLHIKRSKFESWLSFNNKLNVAPLEYKDELGVKKVPVKVNYFEDFQEAFIRHDLEKYIEAYHLTDLQFFDYQTKKQALDA